MKKNIIFMTLVGIMVLCLCGSVAATADSSINTTNLTDSRHVFINVSNDNGTLFNLDGTAFGGPNGTYYVKCDGGGSNALHITNDSNNLNGQVTVITSPSTSSSGVFYITDTGGRGWNDNMILLISVEGPIPDNFEIHITSSGYSFTPTGNRNVDPTDYTYGTGVNETFTKADFKYGPTVWKPGPATLEGWWPLYYGQSTSDSSTSSYLMFVDLYRGTLKEAKFGDGLTDNGAIKVEFTITGMNTLTAFNTYGWCLDSNQGQGISWIQPTTGTASGYSVDYTPITPVADFSADNTSGSNSLTVKFTDTSANYPTSWLWDFGDGTTSTLKDPTHTYSTPGVYTVKLTASNPAGSDDEIKTSYITVLKSNVYVNITSSNPNPQVGDKVTYTFKLGNKGPGIAKDVVFTYVIPDGVEFAGAKVDQGTWSYNETTRTLTWILGDVAVGDPYLWLDLNILSAGSFNINPTVTVAGNDIGSEGNIGSLLISVPTTVNAATETSTVPMQTTGIPVAGLAMALLMVGSGLALGKRK
jgi:uncharacterized repeat protein (TIGR01451 family)